MLSHMCSVERIEGGMGASTCPCLSPARVAAMIGDRTNVTIGDVYIPYGSAPNASFPSSYGVNCYPHDKGTPPYCGPWQCQSPDRTSIRSWCADDWCYVDHQNCNGTYSTSWSPSNYFAPVELYYSYKTCGSMNTFDAFYEEILKESPPPSLPPVSPPPPPTFPGFHETPGFPITIAAGALLVIVLSLLMLYFAWRTRQLAELKASRETERVLAAIETTRSLGHPAVFIAAEAFLSMGQLRSFEELRDDGLLCFRDTLGALSDTEGFGYFYMFISHQWTAWTEPDPTNRQYVAMCAAIRHVASKYNWPLDKVMVWADLCSIPQRCLAQQQHAIRSLVSYASLASAFIIVAPPIEHRDEKVVCDLNSYRSRLWTRTEQLCFALRNGTKRMWLATSAKAEDIVPVDPNDASDGWHVEDALYVFAGNATDEGDKLHLVAPILGLYAGMYAHHMQHAHANFTTDEPIAGSEMSPPESPVLSPTSGGDLAEASTGGLAETSMTSRRRVDNFNRELHHLYSLIEHDKHGVFPRTMELHDTAGRRALEEDRRKKEEKASGAHRYSFRNSKRKSAIASGNMVLREPATKDFSGKSTKTVELFGHLVERCEKMIAHDEALRQRLVKQMTSATGSVRGLERLLSIEEYSPPPVRSSGAASVAPLVTPPPETPARVREAVKRSWRDESAGQSSPKSPAEATRVSSVELMSPDTAVGLHEVTARLKTGDRVKSKRDGLRGQGSLEAIKVVAVPEAEEEEVEVVKAEEDHV